MYKTLIVVDDHQDFQLKGIETIPFSQYLSDYPKIGEPKTRIINLCDVSRYLSRGYYCSLLAEARNHKIVPSVSTINDLRILTSPQVTKSSWDYKLDFKFHISPNLNGEFFIYFGWVQQEELRKIAKKVYETYPFPILKLALSHEAGVTQVQVNGFSFKDLDSNERDLFQEKLEFYIEKIWRQTRSKKYRWDMAILVNPNEKNPPSNKEALKRFVKAASQVGIKADLVVSDQISNLSQYDALFIRETTSIDHPTYILARKAEREGLVVIDDPTSILRCCNKIFLQDAFTYHKVSAPRTIIISKNTPEEIQKIESFLEYPIVLKLPESSFSSGVFKVKTRIELEEKLTILLDQSDIAMAQEYIFTEFDWRIGMLGGKPIYACKYHMAANHWQIYNHGSKKNFSGNFETLPTFEVPKMVLDIAMKSCAIIGQGLYGVDIKQKGNQVYLIEINDNPSIEHGVENQYLGDELYMMIMQEFVNRLELRGRS